MTWLDWTAHLIAALIFMIGLLTVLLPVIPGSVIVWLGILIHKLWMGDASVGWGLVAITGALTAFGLLGDFLLGYWGAKKFGATWKGAVGALLGALVGFFLPPPLFWLIAGPILGAIVGELLAGRTWKAGSKAGFGTLLGGILAFALKFGLSVCIVVLFYLSLILNATTS
ncbi:DUF456 domain-containing protein [Coraliomargarita akajimensis]|uniref:DUF456 domain-containing protein n=1 Tax=Coraliomargarita akajimensis (strain DSM 45221 / IAM 15411 / JCM 23193 / KCTC 12865 / 04OKA010-24) TaxID=583355 RepID=D5EJH4_CORAD|nr:DUF456 domain-containing protein [Coraliomargarita akajimensis]ADE54573.1 protein of unknown function DUF456 [Coraliomargarita akajimensis DSM 45221]